MLSPAAGVDNRGDVGIGARAELRAARASPLSRHRAGRRWRVTRFAVSLVSALLLASCASATGPETPSASAAPEAETAQEASTNHALAFAVQDRAYVVLSREPDVERLSGAPVMRGVTDPLLVEHTPAGTSAAEDAWVGRAVRLYGASGVVCEGIVRRSVLVGRYSPSFETMARLRGEGGGAHDGEADPAEDPSAKAATVEATEEPALTPAEIADEAWTGAVGAGAVVLAGEVDATGCEGALWATPADAPVAFTHPVETAGVVDELAYLARFRALPSWLELQRQYDEAAREDRAPRWDGHGESAPVVNVIALQDAKLVFVTADVGGGCGDFTARSTVVYREDARGVTLMGTTDTAFVPLGAVDVDGDGAVELLVPDGVRFAGQGAYEDVRAVTVPYLGCPC